MRKFKQGFSLIELMITVSIIGILAAIAIPSYVNYINKARIADLMTASHLGQLMVNEYIQSTGATDCINMPGQSGGIVSIPINSVNIDQSNTFIAADTSSTAYGSCSITVQGSRSTFAIATADQFGIIPEVQLASYDNNTLLNESIPFIQLVALKNTTRIFSIPTFNSDGSITWAMYGTGPALPSTILNISSYGGGGFSR